MAQVCGSLSAQKMAWMLQPLAGNGARFKSIRVLLLPRFFSPPRRVEGSTSIVYRMPRPCCEALTPNAARPVASIVLLSRGDNITYDIAEGAKNGVKVPSPQ